MRSLVGRTIGPSDWREVTQDLIDRFADVSQDHQWIHVDVERARTESPFGTTVAHGNLTLSLIDGFRPSLMESAGLQDGRELRLEQGPLSGAGAGGKPGPRRAWRRSRSMTWASGWHQIAQRWTVEVEGTEKPACVAESVVRVLA